LSAKMNKLHHSNIERLSN